MSPCGVGSPVHLDNQPASTVATLASVKPIVIRYISLLIRTKLNSANKHITRDWKRRVRGLVKTEGTRFLNIFPISQTPSAFFLSTKREVYSRVAQTLTGHGYTGEYYKRFNLEESPWCLCSESIGAPILMTQDHILCFCHCYTTDRPTLQKRIPDLMDPSWQPHTLSQPSSLPALAKFITDSGAFTKLGVPFHINLILPPPCDPRPP